ncbi:MAG: cytochrome c biogenesis protein CcsA [Candidatus Accumulibacter sp.]|jgi:ABC-type transport system involved in cytochrome c biogenesis permease subunit|nr:cytochrome c biogenesis protein CcsA [Accumulibacter sp.]
MSWSEFPFLAIPAALCWLAAGLAACRPGASQGRAWPDMLMLAGIALYAFFIAAFWHSLSRPPLRTMGETRLWYALFMALAGHFIYRRWRYSWLLLLSAVVATVFTAVNLLKPEIHSIALMPALQSSFFIPHVIIYILAYALFGMATLTACALIRRRAQGRDDPGLLALTDDLVHIGFGFLVVGLLLGAVWAKQAWGHYWSWDPKETLAFVTGAAYLIYIHLRHQHRGETAVIWTLPAAFALLLLGWFGASLFPGSSLHLYS